jgi:hypothetical protein
LVRYLIWSTLQTLERSAVAAFPVAEAMDNHAKKRATPQVTMQSPMERRALLYVGSHVIPDPQAPRNSQVLDGLLPYANHRRQGFNWNLIANQDEKDEETELGYFTVPVTPRMNAAVDNTWEARRREIEQLYTKEKENLPLPKVIAIMATRGFVKKLVILLLYFLSAKC